MSAPQCFSAIFAKGNSFYDFQFTFLKDRTFPKWGLLLKERICSSRSKFFPLRVVPIDKGSKNENGRVMSL